MVNGADEVPGFVLARSYDGKEQFVLGVEYGGKGPRVYRENLPTPYSLLPTGQLTTSCRLPHLCPGNTSSCFSRLGQRSQSPRV